MRKMNIPNVCYAVSVLLLVGFIIHTIVDYIRYYNTDTLTAAPFYLWVVVNIVCFIAPAIIALIVGAVVKHKKEKEKSLFRKGAD